MQHLQKTGGGGSRLAHPTRMRILRPPTAEEPKDSSPDSLFCTAVHQERFTMPVQPSGSTFFLKIAGVSPNNFHSGNCSQDTAPKGHFFRPLFSTAYTLFQVPYAVSPLLATLTKTAGCVPTLPKMEHAGQLIAAKTIPVTAAPSDSPTLRLLNPSTLALSDHTSAPLVFSSPMYSICPARDLCSRAPGNVVGAFGICSRESPVTVHRCHGQRRQRSKSSRNATTRLAGAHSAQHRSQGHWSELSVARAVQRFSRFGDVSAHAHPSRVARRAPSVFVRVLSGTLRRSHHISRLP